MKKTLLIIPLICMLMLTAVFAVVTVTVDKPTNNTWSVTSNPYFNFTVSSNIPGLTTFECNLTNSTGKSVWSNASVTNNTGYLKANFTKYKLTDSATGYKWSLYCRNDSKVSKTYGAINKTIKIDTTAPVAFTCNDQNNTKGTDISPMINWTQSGDVTSGFSRYWLYFYNGTTKYREVNISSNLTHHYELSLLTSKDFVYSWMIKAYDIAGNVRNATNCGTPNKKYFYSLDITCSNLITGWNVCGALKDNRDASTICDETDCTYISKYNTTHQWQTYSNGSVTNQNMTFNKGQAMFIYVSKTSDWNHKYDITDLSDSGLGQRWNMSDVTLLRIQRFTNGTIGGVTGWNIGCVTNASSETYRSVKYRIGTGVNSTTAQPQNNSRASVPYYSFVNQSSGKYVPGLWNWTIYENASIDYGVCLWHYLDNMSIREFNATL